MVSPRSHRSANGRAAIETLFRTESGTLFDPRVVRVLLDELPERYDT
jgi:HD-GYP domain-containing protein (c-di-GMP phosphodiesterase class II)